MAKSKEYMNEYMKKRYKKRREFIFSVIGNRCIKCGKEDNLHVDHKNPNMKEFSISKIWNYKKEKLLKELEKCQPLCEDCHNKKSLIDGSQSKNKINGEHSNLSKLNSIQVIKIRLSLKNKNISELSREYNVSRGCIRAIRDRITWKHI